MQLSYLERKELLNEIKKLEFIYRDKLNLDDNIKFGVEIEYGDAPRYEINKTIKNLKGEDSICYNEWSFDVEPNITRIINGNIFGGEIVSPIFKNKKEYYQQLKKVCESLRKNGATINDEMAFQIHVSDEILNYQLLNLENLLKLYMIYEDIIYQFGFYGEKPRSFVNTFARCISYELYLILKDKKYDDFSDLINILIDKTGFKKTGLSFWNVSNQKRPSETKKNTLEFRMCNGTVDPVIIQNNINLFCSLIEASSDKNLDIDFINYEAKKFKEGNYTRNITLKDIDRAVEFSDIIFKDDIDKKYFLKQYTM